MLVGFLDTVGNIALAVLGISFLIFIHELGHFIAARAFGVRVETFSIGFGPRVFGTRRGETDYRLSAIPLGGYVKMAGEYGDYDDDTVLADDDLNAKPAWQRAVIFSGGVAVNFLFAFIAFPIAFALGVPFTAPTLGWVEEGSAAWQAGLQPGDVVTSVAGRRIYEFADIRLEVALGDPGGIPFEFLRDGEQMHVLLVPDRNEVEGRFEIGVWPADSDEIVVDAGGAAEAAGLKDGDRIVSVNGLPFAGDPSASVGIGRLLGQDGALQVTFSRDGQPSTVTIQPRSFDPEGQTRQLGVRTASARVVALRGSADQALGFPLRVEDVVQSVAGTAVASGQGILKQLAGNPPGPVRIRLLRQGEPRDIELTPGQRLALESGDVAFGLEREAFRLEVSPGGAADSAGMRSGDILRAFDGVHMQSYAELIEAVQGSEESRHSVRFFRPDEQRELTITLDTLPTPGRDPGFALRLAQIRHEVGLTGAIVAGFDTSVNGLRTTWLTLTKLISGDVSTKNIGGIVAISKATYEQAEHDFAKLLFFLALLSINLGFINILPIPVLDGGQVLFLLFEKIKGRRLSERFLSGAQLIGLVAILLLVVYVTYNDIQRLIT